MLEELVVQCGAPTLAGLKTGSLFVCPCETQEGLVAELQRINRALSPCGLRIMPLRFSAERALLYLFRPKRLEKDLQCPCAKKILTDAGYQDAGLGKCMQCLIRRLQGGEDFPHEIGLFLSYPPEDVQGFIENRAQNYKVIGVWKVYGDEEKARKTFAQYKKCTESYCRAFRAGKKLEQLAVAI